jgi:hypothetical protein
MRLHVIAVFGHQLPHCFEVGPQCWKNRREWWRIDTIPSQPSTQACLKMTSVARVVLFEGDAFMRFARMRLRSTIGMNRGSSPSSSSRSNA